MARFKIGDRVRVRPDGHAAMFAGTEGVIDGIEPNERGIGILDRYMVLFKWGEKKHFYDAHLEPLSK